MANKVIQFIAVDYPLPIFGLSGIVVFIIGLVMLTKLFSMTSPTISFAIFTMTVCISAVILILGAFILFALSELRRHILKKEWYNS